jgi:hypothetical protein
MVSTAAARGKDVQAMLAIEYFSSTKPMSKAYIGLKKQRPSANLTD